MARISLIVMWVLLAYATSHLYHTLSMWVLLGLGIWLSVGLLRDKAQVSRTISWIFRPEILLSVIPALYILSRTIAWTRLFA